MKQPVKATNLHQELLSPTNSFRQEKSHHKNDLAILQVKQDMMNILVIK